MKDAVMIRLNKVLLDKLRSVAARHPLKPTLRASVERGIELMVKGLEEETKNAK